MFDTVTSTLADRTVRSASLTPKLSLSAFEMSYAPNEEIFAEEEEADFVYKVVSGAVRSTRLLSDGRRQIAAFHLEGDVFGLERGPQHRFTAEAIMDSRVALVRRSAVERLAEQNCEASRELWMLACRELEALQDHMLLLSRKSALERVSTFLTKLFLRSPNGSILLPMSRGDIADHLGLTLETVSRALSQLVRDGVIALPSPRRVELRRPEALAA